MKRTLLSLLLLLTLTSAYAQLPKVYDEQIDPMAQIDSAIEKAKSTDRFVICQVGGNWCSWCLKFADFTKNDTTISKVIEDNFVYIHVNYPRQGASQQLSQRILGAGRFGYPVFVVMDTEGKVIHIQDSSYLEEDKGYNKDKVLRFFQGWTPKAVKQVP